MSVFFNIVKKVLTEVATLEPVKWSGIKKGKEALEASFTISKAV